MSQHGRSIVHTEAEPDTANEPAPDPATDAVTDPATEPETTPVPNPTLTPLPILPPTPFPSPPPDPSNQHVPVILVGMTSPLYLSPLLRWDGLHLVVNFEMVERYLRNYVSRMENLRELHLEGEGDAIRVRATVKYRFLTTRLAFDIAEIRLKRRHFGFRLRRPRVMGGGPLPRRAVLKALKMIGLEEVTVLGGDGIVIVDLGQWLPEQLFFDVRTVQATERFLHIWLGPGAIHDLPPGTIPSLAAGD